MVLKPLMQGSQVAVQLLTNRGRVGPDAYDVQSSAYDVSLMPSGGVGSPDM